MIAPTSRPNEACGTLASVWRSAAWACPGWGGVANSGRHSGPGGTPKPPSRIAVTGLRNRRHASSTRINTAEGTMADVT